MSAAPVDITDLVAQEQAVVETPELEKVDIAAPEETLEPKVDAEKTPEVKKTDEPKVEDAEKVEDKKKEDAASINQKPEALAKSVHEALKSFMGEKPTEQGKELLRKINTEVGQLYKVAAQAKAEAGNISEVVSSAKELQESVENSDRLIYGSDDPKNAEEIASVIYEDICSNSKPEAFDGFVSAALDKLQQERPEAFYAHVLKNYSHALEQTGMNTAVSNLIRHFNAGNAKGLRESISGIAQHLSDVQGKSQERVKQAEVAKVEKVAAETRANLESEMALDSKKALGAALSPWLRDTELGTYDRSVLVELSRVILQDANAKLDSDRTFNALLQKLYKAGDIEGVKKAGREKIQNLAKELVAASIKKVYPNGLEKRAAKSAATPKMIKTPAGNAIYVAVKPTDLDRERKGWDILSMHGCGYRKGSSQLITWKAKH